MASGETFSIAFYSRATLRRVVDEDMFLHLWLKAPLTRKGQGHVSQSIPWVLSEGKKKAFLFCKQVIFQQLWMHKVIEYLKVIRSSQTQLSALANNGR